MQSTWLSLWTAFLSKFEKKFNFKLIDLSLQQLLQSFRCRASVYYIADLLQCLWDLHVAGDVNWQNLRAGNTQSCVE